MFNLRQVDGVFFLSGGWQNIVAGGEDLEELDAHNIRFVLDLQFTPADGEGEAAAYVKETLSAAGIEYTHRFMYDGDFGQDIEAAWKDTNVVLKSFSALRSPGQHILVKCSAGLSRSPSTLIAYYCESEHLTFTEARAKLQSSDRVADLATSITPFFERHLKDLYGFAAPIGWKHG